MFTTITDILAPELDPFRDLKDRRLKDRDGLFVAEGLEVVRRLLRSPLRVRAVLGTSEKLRRLADDLPADVPALAGSAEQIERIVGFDARRFGVLACGWRPAPLDLDAALACRNRDTNDEHRLVVVLENISDAENVGVIIRSAAAFGADLVILGDCCDPFYRRASRVSMGSVFSQPLFVSDDLCADLAELRRRRGFELVAAVLSESATPLHAAARAARTALVFGAEGHGLTGKLREICDHEVMIPMSPGADSLNVAVAAGVFLHHYARVSDTCR